METPEEKLFHCLTNDNKTDYVAIGFEGTNGRGSVRIMNEGTSTTFLKKDEIVELVRHLIDCIEYIESKE